MIKLVILGEPASKANSRQLVTFGKGDAKRPAIIKSKKARDYERDALLQIPYHAKQMLQGELRITIKIFYASERPDLDEAVILDVLQAKKKNGEIVRRGVYLNDRQVREKHIFHAIDRSNPRAEIQVEQIVTDPMQRFFTLNVGAIPRFWEPSDTIRFCNQCQLSKPRHTFRNLSQTRNRRDVCEECYERIIAAREMMKREKHA